jgi:hypothetical protein
MRQLILGLFVLLTLGLLGYYTLFLADVDLFGSKTELTVEFPEAGDLREGDAVLLAGMRVGRVKSIAYDPEAPLERRIVVTLALDEPPVLREDYVVLITDATVLGGHNVEIEPGDPSFARLDLETVGALRGRVKPSAFEALSSVGDLFDSSEGTLFGDLAAIVSELRERGAGESLANTLDNFETASGDIAELTTGLREGKGTLGALFQTKEFYDTWNDVGTGLNETIADVRAGEGLLPALLSDGELRTSTTDAVANVRDTFDRADALLEGVQSGSGLAGRLFSDEKLSQDVADGVADFRKLADDLANGQGTLPRLIQDEALYADVEAIAKNIRGFSEDLSNPDGTLGKILSDDSIYNRLDLALETLTRSLEDYREAAPVTTFTSLLFGGL